MLGSQILDILIGMAFIYLLLSLVCSAVNELIASVKSLRAKTLEQGIRTLVSDEKLAQKIYKHPIIKGLYKGDRLPSYIPARTFVMALLDIAVPTKPGESKTIQDAQELASKIDANTELSNDIKQALTTLIASAEKDLNQARTNIETWFDDSMERVGGWYKRETQKIVLMIAVVTTVALNADSVMMLTLFSRDTALRASVVAAAEDAVRKSEPPANVSAQLEKLQAPLGWSFADPMQSPQDLRRFPQNGAEWFSKFAGLLVTTIAISLGAPFWFDLLNKLVQLRGAGNEPKKEEKSKKRSSANKDE